MLGSSTVGSLGSCEGWLVVTTSLFSLPVPVTALLKNNIYNGLIKEALLGNAYFCAKTKKIMEINKNAL